MSAHSRRPVSLTRRAQRDVADILAYSLQQWGPEQELRHAEALQRALALIGENPLLGRARDDLRPGLRTYPIEPHLIFYEVRRNTVRVARIVHQRMDARRVLGG